MKTIESLDKSIEELERSLYIDSIRLDKKWHPVIIPQIIELQKAKKLLLKSTDTFTCCKKLCKGCECMKYINKNK